MDGMKQPWARKTSYSFKSAENVMREWLSDDQTAKMLHIHRMSKAIIILKNLRKTNTHQTNIEFEWSKGINNKKEEINNIHNPEKVLPARE